MVGHVVEGMIHTHINGPVPLDLPGLPAKGQGTSDSLYDDSLTLLKFPLQQAYYPFGGAVDKYTFRGDTQGENYQFQFT